MVNEARDTGQRTGRHIRHALAWQPCWAKSSSGLCNEVSHARAKMAPHMRAAIWINAALGGLIKFETDSSVNMVGSIEVSRCTSEGGATGRRLRHASMLTQGKYAGSSAYAPRSCRQWCTAQAAHTSRCWHAGQACSKHCRKQAHAAGAKRWVPGMYAAVARYHANRARTTQRWQVARTSAQGECAYTGCMTWVHINGQHHMLDIGRSQYQKPREVEVHGSAATGTSPSPRHSRYTAAMRYFGAAGVTLTFQVSWSHIRAQL